MRDLLLVIFFFIVVYFTFKRPFIGVCAWIWIALTAPTLWAFGFSTHLRLNLSIVLITFIAYVVAEKNKSVHLSKIGWLVLLFCFWTFLSSLTHITYETAKIWGYFVDFIKVVMLFFFAILLLKKRYQIDTFIWCIVLSVSSYAGMEGLKFLLSGGGHEVVGRAGVIQDRNDFAVAINMSLPLIAYLYFTAKHKLIRLGLLGLAALNVIAVIGTYSRGGFIGLAILAIAFWWRSKYKIPLALLAFLLVPILYQKAPEDWRERQTTVATAATEDSSFIGRLWAWKISSMIALDHPLTGGGFRAVTNPIVWSNYAPYTADFGPIQTPAIPPELRPKAAHNIYFQVLGDHGFVGLIIFLAMLGSTYFSNLRTNKLCRNQPEHLWLYHLSSALNLSIIGYGITGANVSLAYFDLLYAVLAIVVAMQLLRPATAVVKTRSQF
ncbi:MAG: putative O-glycosylation ligase, exosortase A system-associated [Gammaproteobacteria bacterium]|nr:putative O-glycosylation ligase, exosortase A system-associated [Gammaproteobacteria bacterium]MBU1555295.1 putative O-glycosylation ligase, exosortase A system-associated [Gammaproteobacteria bacterium]MBU2069231.1 putative O-glycosylation ligase, exosortase A system-associated [Gammaproteobacteria bacterium]MBU2182326.1 putative O-glycosylation ligase, exosortase A system-associated [Gammaproteobacteria bacterium]MBU2204902.1 putative O-glycosylation ligase, exosortase A system-associated 